MQAPADEVGAGSEDRTRDLKITNLALYQLSYPGGFEDGCNEPDLLLLIILHGGSPEFFGNRGGLLPYF